MGKVTSIDIPSKAKSPAKGVTQEHWEKAREAYELLVAGKSRSEIAEELNIAHVDDVWRLMTERFKYDAARMSDEDRKDVLHMEILRLNALQAAVWPSAMMGDPRSIDSAIKIIQTRCKITGLEQVDPVINKNLVLVMGEKEQDYIAALKATSD